MNEHFCASIAGAASTAALCWALETETAPAGARSDTTFTYQARLHDDGSLAHRAPGCMAQEEIQS
jgi:hypothetical protein